MAPTEASASAPRSIVYWMGWLALGTLCWGASFPLIKGVAGVFPPMTLASLRGLGGGLSLLLVFLVLRQDFRPRSLRETVDWVILGAFNGWLANLLVNYALKTMPPGQAALIQCCGPLITAIVASLLFAEERLTLNRIGGILLGFCGVALIIGPRLFGAGATPLAVLAMIGVASCYATGTIYVRLLPVADPKRLALGQQLMSALFASAFALLAHGLESFTPAAQHWLPILAIGVIATAVPMLIYMAVLRAIGPTRASLAGYMVPTWAVLLSAITLGELLALRELVGGLVVMAGVWLTSMKR